MGGETMETYFYKCPVCGFVYPVPDYWVSFAPEAAMEFAHENSETGSNCENDTLALLSPDK